MRRTPVYLDDPTYEVILVQGRPRSLVHRVSARMDTSFVGLTVEELKGYTRKAIMEAPLELEITRFRRTAARTMRA